MVLPSRRWAVLLLAALLCCGACAGSRPRLVAKYDTGFMAANRVWIHLYEDATFKGRDMWGINRGRWSVDGSRLHLQPAVTGMPLTLPDAWVIEPGRLRLDDEAESPIYVHEMWRRR